MFKTETNATFGLSSGARTLILLVSNGIAEPGPKTLSTALAILLAVEESPCVNSKLQNLYLETLLEPVVQPMPLGSYRQLVC